MATKFSGSLFPTNTSNAIRDWAQFVEDTLVTTGGWVVTSDTGQTAPASLSTPGGLNTKAGYRIYRMADTLQATSPVFMRLDYGSSPGAATTPAIWVTIGTGSSGTGTITGIVFNGGAVANGTVFCSSGNTSLANNCYGSASTSRFNIAMFIQQTSATYEFVFTLERTKDSSGADTGDGLLMIWSDSVTGAGLLQASKYMILAGGTQPTTEAGLNYVLSVQNPTEAFAPGDVALGVVICIRGTAQQPGTNMMISASGDVSTLGSFSITLYGATRTYQNLGTLMIPQKVLTGVTYTADANGRCNMRYD